MHIFDADYVAAGIAVMIAQPQCRCRSNLYRRASILLRYMLSRFFTAASEAALVHALKLS